MKSPLTLAAISMIAGFFAAKWVISLLNPVTPVAVRQAEPLIELPGPADAVVSNVIRFPLTMADVPLDREYPAIVADPKNKVILAAWAAATRPDSGNKSRTIWLTRSADGGKSFETPKAWREVPIYAFTSGGGGKKNGDTARAPMQFSTHVLPRLIMAGERVVLGWVEAIGDGPKAAFYVAESTDGGVTFSQPRAIGGDQVSKPGFIALSADNQGHVLAAWLDNPAKAGNVEAGSKREDSLVDEKQKKAGSSGGGPKVFVCRELADKSGFEPARIVYEGADNKGVCPCCDVAVAAGPENQAFYAFRNNIADIRDIWAGNTNEGKTEAPFALSNRGWNFGGCPHDGPSMIRLGDKIVTGWMDAKDGKPRVFLSDFNAGAHSQIQTVPVTQNSEGSQSHVKLAPDGQGGLYLAWDQTELKQPGKHEGHASNSIENNSSRGIVVAYRPAGSMNIASRMEIKAPNDRLPRNPVIAVTEDAIILAWSELGGPEGKSVRVEHVLKSDLRPVETDSATIENKTVSP